MDLEVEARRAKGAGWKSVYDALRTEILSLELAPGQPLDETTSRSASACHARRCGKP